MNKIICIWLILTITSIFSSSYAESVNDSMSEQNIKLAILWYNQGQIDNAQTALGIEEAQKSKDPRVYYYLGLINYDKNNFDKAEKYYLKTIQIDPTFAGAYTEIADIKVRQKNVPEANKYIEKSISLNSTNANSYMVYANVLTLLGQNDKSKEQVDKAAQISPPVVFGQGSQFLKMNDPKSALYYFHIAEKYAPKEPIVLFHIGQSYRMLQDVPQTLKYLEMAYNYSDTNYQYFNFGVIYSTYFRYSLDTGNYDTIYKRIFEKVDKNYPSAYLFLALANFKNKKMSEFKEQAKKYFLYSKEKEPNSLEDWANEYVK